LLSEDGKLFWLQMVRFTTTENCVNNLKENITFKPVTAKLSSALQRKGPHFIDEMNGIFGFAIYDVDKDEYFIARDHMGLFHYMVGITELLCSFRIKST
jgi:asparagine synthase (glutamine-hydrolysing)